MTTVKRTLVLLLAFCAVTLNAAQCEGLTKTGVRCKREAAENSKFCLGHADQANPPKAEKPAAEKPKPEKPNVETPKDDGTCWAVTEKGTRCKHKKDGESDYCKQHAADKKLSTPCKQCRALKWDGKQCERAPQPSCYYCKQHAKLGETATPAAAKPAAKGTKDAAGAVRADVICN